MNAVKIYAADFPLVKSAFRHEETMNGTIFVEREREREREY